jgi:hypothetical protein
MSKGREVITFILLLVLVSACNLPGGSAITGGTEPVPISMSDTANPVPLAATDTPGPTLTVTFTPSSTATSTPSHPLISVSTDTNCRSGPGQVYDYLGGLQEGETAEVIAKDPTGQFWYIQNPDAPGYCWVWGKYATIVGDTGPLPAYTPMPTPTPTPSFTFEYSSWDHCVSMYYLKFTSTNTGGVAWESFSLFVRDNTRSIAKTWSDNRFANPSNCGAEPPVPTSIPPGGSGTVMTVASFMDHAPTGDSIDATLTLCTQDNLMGQCVTNSISFTP